MISARAVKLDFLTFGIAIRVLAEVDARSVLIVKFTNEGKRASALNEVNV